VSIGLNGAIQRLVVNGEAYDDLSRRATSRKGVAHFTGAPCGSVSPCKNGGVCHPRLSNFVCKCAPRHIGPHCEQRESRHLE
jgi:hypothetical protein